MGGKHSCGVLELEPKEDIASRHGRSPDVTDALSMAISKVASGTRQREPIYWS